MGVKNANTAGTSKVKEQPRIESMFIPFYNFIVVSRTNFDFMYVIGRGGFGKVK
jgi:hypothetical protein